MTADQIFPWVMLVALLLNGAVGLIGHKMLRKAQGATIKSKQTEIESLKQQIDTLRQLTSPEVLKHFKATKEMLEDKIGRYEQDITQKDEEIAESNSRHQVAELEKLAMEKQHAQAMLQLSTDIHQQVSDLGFYIRESVVLLGDSVRAEIAPPSTSPPQETDS